MLMEGLSQSEYEAGRPGLRRRKSGLDTRPRSRTMERSQTPATFFGVGGNQEYGKALLSPLPQRQVEFVASTHIDASGRFFEDEYCQVFDQPAGQAGLLLIAAREQAQRLVEMGGANP